MASEISFLSKYGTRKRKKNYFPKLSNPNGDRVTRMKPKILYRREVDTLSCYHSYKTLLANSTWLSNECTRENVCSEGVIRSRATSCQGTQRCFEVGPQTEECSSQAPAGHASLVTGTAAVRRQPEVNWEPFGKSEDGRTNWEKWEQRYREIVGRSKNNKHD